MSDTARSSESQVLERELAYHEQLYSGFAQKHFARPGVVALRRHMVQRILSLTGAGKASRVLSIGCGIGDTELLLAPHVKEIVGTDLSPTAIRQANTDAEERGIMNARFIEGQVDKSEGRFDVVIAIFLLHHLSDSALAEFPTQMASLVRPGGVFYSLDPSNKRASGAVGRVVVPWLMKKYQTPDERELDPETTRALFGPPLFGKDWLEVRTKTYDFCATPVAGLFPRSRGIFRAARRLDDALLNLRLFRTYGSNFEIVARKA